MHHTALSLRMSTHQETKTHEKKHGFGVISSDVYTGPETMRVIKLCANSRIMQTKQTFPDEKL